MSVNSKAVMVSGFHLLNCQGALTNILLFLTIAERHLGSIE